MLWVNGLKTWENLGKNGLEWAAMVSTSAARHNSQRGLIDTNNDLINIKFYQYVS